MTDKPQPDRRGGSPQPPRKPPPAAKAKQRPASKGRVRKGKSRS